jgi:hypothetical protein
LTRMSRCNYPHVVPVNYLSKEPWCACDVGSLGAGQIATLNIIYGKANTCSVGYNSVFIGLIRNTLLFSGGCHHWIYLLQRVWWLPICRLSEGRYQQSRRSYGYRLEWANTARELVSFFWPIRWHLAKIVNDDLSNLGDQTPPNAVNSKAWVHFRVTSSKVS